MKIKKFILYTGFWTAWTACVAVMFVMLTAAVMGIPAGVMLACLGLIIVTFKVDFIITELAPEIMLFGGLAGACFAAFLGAVAVKLGFLISRLFTRVRRRVEGLR